MNRVTKESLKNTDINLERVENRLKKIADAIHTNNRNNLTDINVICEEIFGRILNDLYDIKLTSLSAEVSGNYIAVDLVDLEKRIAYQVTSRNDRKKIKSTIEKFNDSEIYKDIDELYFLILSCDEHKYIKEDKIQLKNGMKFSFQENIMTFNKLILEIQNKCQTDKDFIVKVYDYIGMVYDSGRLYYRSIVQETEELKRQTNLVTFNTKSWTKGYGDIWLHAFIPMSYEGELSCLLLLRQHNLSGANITFGEETLLREYLISEPEFVEKHHVGRYEDEEEMWMQIENIRFSVNAHTAHHIYQLFNELRKEYIETRRQIDEILGTVGMRREGNKYYLMSVEKKTWKEILFFAQDHDCSNTKGEMKWNIFNNSWSKTRLILAPNLNGKTEGVIFAKISVQQNENYDNKFDLYWEPGFKVYENCMEGFDNVIKWKANYTKDWIKNELIGKAHLYYEEYNKQTILGRLLGI